MTANIADLLIMLAALAGVGMAWLAFWQGRRAWRLALDSRARIEALEARLGHERTNS